MFRWLQLAPDQSFLALPSTERLATPPWAVDDAELRFLVWDFAGQREYYITHSFFLRPGALPE